MPKFLSGFVTGVVILPVVAVLTAWLGFLPTHANATPPQWERAFAQMALNAYVAGTHRMSTTRFR